MIPSNPIDFASASNKLDSPSGFQKRDERSQSGRTPSSNTGLKCQTPKTDGVGREQPGTVKSMLPESSVDWWQGTRVFPNEELMWEAINLAIETLGDDQLVREPEKPWVHGIVFDHSARSVRGARVGYRQNEQGGWHCLLSLPGRCLRQASTMTQWTLLLALYHAYGFKCTRIDLKIRDYARIRLPEQILADAEAGHVKGFRVFSFHGRGKIGEKPTTTAYLGSPKSQKRLRVYDASPVHGEDAIDWELELHDEHAQSVFEALTSITSTGLSDAELERLVARSIAVRVTGAVDFVEPVADVRRSRLQLQPWWVDFCEMVGGSVKIKLAKVERTLDRSLKWWGKQVVTTVAMFREVFGRVSFDRWVDEKLHQATMRFTPWHLAQIDIATREAA